MTPLQSFLSELSSYQAEVGVFNPWSDFDPDLDIGKEAPEIRRKNLEQYLETRLNRARYLLVAEALGYQGGRFSGIAMTSERMLIGKHKQVAPSQILPAGRTQRTSNAQCSQLEASQKKSGFTEPTATTVWTTILDNDLDPYEIILWNIFPFHPYHPDNQDPIKGLLTNRSGPTADELKTGGRYLRKLLALCRQSIEVIAIGRPSEKILKELGVDHLHVPHPAKGGTPEFKRQLKEIVVPKAPKL